MVHVLIRRRNIIAHRAANSQNNWPVISPISIGQTARMGINGLESRLIAAVANCRLCKPSQSWLGRHSSKRQIRQGKMWIVQHLRAQPLSSKDSKDKEVVALAIEKTKAFCKM
jgi:hypothetical protein